MRSIGWEFFGVVDGTQNKTSLWSTLIQKVQSFNDLPILKLTDTLEFGQIRGLNGQIHVISGESYKAWLSARGPKPPKIQFYLDQAHAWRERLDRTPALTHSKLGAEVGISRSEIIHTLNLLKLAPGIQSFIRLLPPSPRACPLTKKKLRSLATKQKQSDQLKEFTQMVPDLFGNDSSYINLLNQALGQNGVPPQKRPEIEILKTENKNVEETQSANGQPGNTFRSFSR